MASKLKAQLERIAGLLLPSPLLFVLAPVAAFDSADNSSLTTPMQLDREGKQAIFLREPLNSPDSNLFAAHRSHSSHRSHYSSRGGSSAPSYSSPAPAPSPAPPRKTVQSAETEPAASSTPELPPSSGFYNPAPSPASNLTTKTPSTGLSPQSPTLGEQLGSPANALRKPASATGSLARRDRLTMTIMHVQLALLGLGYSVEAVDGVMSQETQNALRQFQQDKGLKTTGTMTTETLNSLDVKVSSE